MQPARILVACQTLLQFVPLFGRDFAIEKGGELGFERQFPKIEQIQNLWIGWVPASPANCSLAVASCETTFATGMPMMSAACW